MRESELERGLGALVPHTGTCNLSGVRWKRRHKERATGLDFVSWCTCSSPTSTWLYAAPGLAAKALETELAAPVLGDRKLVMRFMTN